MPSLTIRQYGDPVLKERARDVDDIDGAVASLVDSMIETMYDAPGHGPGRQPGGRAAADLRLRRRGGCPRRHQPPHRRERRGVGLRRGLPVDARPQLGDRAPERGAPRRASTSTGTRSPSRRPSSRAGSSSTSSTTSTASCWSSGSTRTSARRRSRSCAAARWTCRRPTPTGSPASSRADPSGRPRTGHARRSGPLPYGERVARLAYLGTPDMAVPPLRALVGGRARRRPLRDPARPPAGPRRADDAEPGQGGRHRARASRSPTTWTTWPTAGVELAVVVAFGRIIPRPTARAASRW